MQTETEIQNELLPAVSESGVGEAVEQLLIERFTPFLEEAKGWKEKAESLVVTDISQVREMKMAREARLAIREVRINADKARKELKEDSLRYGRAVQGVYNVIESVIAPIEDHLLNQEKFKERYEQLLKAELRAEREKITAPYREYLYANIDLGELIEEDFEKMLNGAKLQKQQADDLAAKVEADRVARIKAEVEERERLRIENEKLKEQAIVREVEMQKERDRLEAEQRKANIEAARVRKEAEAVAEKERIEREKLKAELKAKEDAEAEAEAAKQAAIEAEAAKGDKQKMVDLIAELSSLPLKYSFKSKKHMAIHKAIVDLVSKTVSYAESKL